MNEEKKVIASRSEFKGNPMLVLSSGPEDKFPFSFGIAKARRIVACIPDIQKFVEEQDENRVVAK